VKDSQIRDIEVTVDGATETIRAEKVHDNVYYCLESLVFINLELYGCEIEVEELDGKLIFLRIHKQSKFKTHVYVWSQEYLNSQKAKKIKNRILEVGGDCEQVMGGVFFIHLPEDRDFLLEEILDFGE
jgi:uncharacterized protein YjbK